MKTFARQERKSFEGLNTSWQYPVPDKRGGLNGSTQHELEVYLQEPQKLDSFASVDSNGTLPCLGLMEYSPKDRFSMRSIVGPTDEKVLHQPVKLAALFGNWLFDPRSIVIVLY